MTEEQDDHYMSDPRAKTIKGFIAGLTILANHMPKGLDQDFAIGAAHDVIYVWGEVRLDKLSPDSVDGMALIALGFLPDEELDQWSYFT